LWLGVIRCLDAYFGVWFGRDFVFNLNPNEFN
jgi:hypothetical protein